MKKIILLFSLWMMAMTVYAKGGQEHIGYKFIEQGAVVTSFNKEYYGELVVPASISYQGKTFPVVAIKDKAFANCGGLTRVTLPESVCYIGESAFLNCKNLAAINIPEAITKIENSTFFGCKSLKDVKFPKSLEAIGEKAFTGCGFATLIIPTTVKKIGREAFYGLNSNLKSVTIPAAISYIGYNAFNGTSDRDETLEVTILKDNTEENFDLAVETPVLRKGSVLIVPKGCKKLYKLKFKNEDSLKIKEQ